MPGKHSLPNHYKNKFDVVSSSGNLDVGKMPNRGLVEMAKALKKGGIAAFSI